MEEKKAMASGARRWSLLVKARDVLLDLRRRFPGPSKRGRIAIDRTFKVHPSDDRLAADGQYLVQLTAEGADRARLSFGRYVAVESKGMAARRWPVDNRTNLAIAKLAQVDDEERKQKLESDACGLDQTIREIIGIEPAPKPGQPTASPPPRNVSVTLSPIRLPPHGVLGVTPRRLLLHYLVLPLEYIEKRVVCLSERSLRLLGINEGEYVTLICASGEAPKLTVRSLSVRAFHIPESEELLEAYGGDKFPDISRNIYIDRDIRKDLGIPVGQRGYPILVAPAVRSLLRGRLMFYGVSIFLGFTAFNEIVQGVTNLPESGGIGIAAALTLLSTFAFVILDLRGRLQN